MTTAPAPSPTPTPTQTEAEKKPEVITETEKQKPIKADTNSNVAGTLNDKEAETAKKFDEQMKLKFGEKPTTGAVTHILKNSSETFKDVVKHEDAMKILKEGDKKGNGKHPEMYEWLTKHIITSDKAKNMNDAETEKMVKERGYTPTKEVREQAEKVREEYKKYEEIEKKEKKEKKEEEKLEAKSEPQSKAETFTKTEAPEAQTQHTTKRGFFGTIGRGITRPFRKTWQAAKWTGRTARRGTKLIANSAIATVQTAAKTARSPIGWLSHVLGYQDKAKTITEGGKDGIKAWREGYRKYRGFKK